MLQADFRMEAAAIEDLRHAIHYAEESKDFGTVELLSAILVSEEEHYLWLEQQLRIIKEVGEKNYLQSAI